MRLVAVGVLLVCGACSSEGSKESAGTSGRPSSSGCSKDTDCKGDRVCVDRECVGLGAGGSSGAGGVSEESGGRTSNGGAVSGSGGTLSDASTPGSGGDSIDAGSCYIWAGGMGTGPLGRQLKAIECPPGYAPGDIIGDGSGGASGTGGAQGSGGSSGAGGAVAQCSSFADCLNQHPLPTGGDACDRPVARIDAIDACVAFVDCTCSSCVAGSLACEDWKIEQRGCNSVLAGRGMSNSSSALRLRSYLETYCP